MLPGVGDAIDHIREQWGRERPELDTEAMGILARVFRVAAAAYEVKDRTCALHGISRGDYDVLATLRRSGEPFQLGPGELSRSLLLTSGGMTGRLDRLERAGLVTRSPGARDRRSLLVSLTEHGRRVIDDAVDASVRSQQQLLAGLPPDRRRQLDDLLHDLLALVTADPQGERSAAVAGRDPDRWNDTDVGRLQTVSPSAEQLSESLPA